MATELARPGESQPRPPGLSGLFPEIRYGWEGTNCAEALNTEVIQKQDEIVSTPSSHPNCLISLKRYKKLITMAQESHKPIFHLKPTDGAIGVHIYAVRDVYKDFKDLGEKIASRTELVLPNSQLTLEPELKSFKCIERLGCRSNGEFERQ